MISRYSSNIRHNTNHNHYDEGKAEAEYKQRASILFMEYYYDQGMEYKAAMTKANEDARKELE